MHDLRDSPAMQLDAELMNKVDGLCGFYTGYDHDDKTKPDGKLAATMKDYGQSWALDDQPCEEKPKCTVAQSAESFRLCDAIRCVLRGFFCCCCCWFPRGTFRDVEHLCLFSPLVHERTSSRLVSPRLIPRCYVTFFPAPLGTTPSPSATRQWILPSS